MYIVFRTPFSKEYIIEASGDELISECREILYDEFKVEPDSYFLTIEPSLDNISNNMSLKELGVESGSVISMGFSEEFMQKKRKEEKEQQFTRVLLKPHTTEVYMNTIPKDKLAEIKPENKEEVQNDEIIAFDPKRDPSNVKYLVEQMMETGASKEDALRALRKTNYDFVNACLLLEDEDGDETQTKKAPPSPPPKTAPRAQNTAVHIPKKLLEGLNQDERASLEKLVNKFGEVQIVYDVFIACEKNERSANSVLSEYITP